MPDGPAPRDRTARFPRCRTNRLRGTEHPTSTVSDEPTPGHRMFRFRALPSSRTRAPVYEECSRNARDLGIRDETAGHGTLSTCPTQQFPVRATGQPTAPHNHRHRTPRGTALPPSPLLPPPSPLLLTLISLSPPSELCALVAMARCGNESAELGRGHRARPGVVAGRRVSGVRATLGPGGEDRCRHRTEQAVVDPEGTMVRDRTPLAHASPPHAPRR